MAEQALESATEAAAQVRALVERFYAAAHADPLLGPFFAATIPDWPEHLNTVSAFWSRALLGVDGYRGCVMGAHVRLRMTPAHFDRWMALFEQSARATLAPALAEQALSVANVLDERLRSLSQARPAT